MFLALIEIDEQTERPDLGDILYNANKFKYLLLSFKTIIKKYVWIIIKKESRMWPISWFIFPFKTWDTEYNCFWIFSFDANWRT